MKPLFLTAQEAAVLSTFGNDSEASIADIAVSAKLIPSEVREAVEGLESKSFVKFKVAPRGSAYNVTRLVNLTPSGYAAQRTLKSHTDRVFITGSSTVARGV